MCRGRRGEIHVTAKLKLERDFVCVALGRGARRGKVAIFLQGEIAPLQVSFSHRSVRSGDRRSDEEGDGLTEHEKTSRRWHTASSSEAGRAQFEGGRIQGEYSEKRVNSGELISSIASPGFSPSAEETQQQDHRRLSSDHPRRGS